MEKKLPLEEKTIENIYYSAGLPLIYTIPIYQRNYAWSDDQIKALVDDVYDSYLKNKSARYYIGTLVTFKRAETVYEVIDGQQRLTTIFLLLKAMGLPKPANELTYVARRASAEALHSLPDTDSVKDDAIKNGFKKAVEYISAIDEKDKQGFRDYFLNKVSIIHYEVPKDVDLNHYFEVMNSRGEQLEKHEIVKSMLCQCLDDKHQIATFGRLWEACTDMGSYIQQAFPDSQIFGNALDGFDITSFDDIPQSNPDDGKKSILEIMQMVPAEVKTGVKNERIDGFQPIIDFSNLLQVVLKLTLMRYRCDCYGDIVLDDKELLNSFGDVLSQVNNPASFARIFGFNLLKARFLIDNFAVHHSLSDKERLGDNPWSLGKLYRETTGKSYPKNLINDFDTQIEAVHLLSMFEVTFSAKQRKNYLFYVLDYLFDIDDLRNPDGKAYTDFLRNLADKFMLDVYLNTDCLNERNQPVPNAFDSMMLRDYKVCRHCEASLYGALDAFYDIYVTGRSDIPLFVFNYTDYKIWKKYAEQMRGHRYKKHEAERVSFFKELGCSDFELDAFNLFYFSRTRKSLEHFIPVQKPATAMTCARHSSK